MTTCILAVITYKNLKKKRTVHLTRFLLRQGEPGTSQYPQTDKQTDGRTDGRKRISALSPCFAKATRSIKTLQTEN